MTYDNIVILTGAGISAESGLLTFRDNNGLWCNHRIEDVATPEAFARDPKLVHEFYNMRRAQLKDVVPNAAHKALAKLQKQHPGRVTIITQNVDDLHERAGANVIHMHGELKKIRCARCDTSKHWEEDIDTQTGCLTCKVKGFMRPDIVWFGEMPMHMEAIDQALNVCDLFISIGTSGNVYPAAGFVVQVRTMGRGHTVELNLEPSLGETLFEEKIYGKASEIVPEYLSKVLNIK
jgi:NAD-dependent deacetylase